MRQPRLPHRVVPLWVYEPRGKAQGQVVLPQVSANVQEKKMRTKTLITDLLFLWLSSQVRHSKKLAFKEPQVLIYSTKVV